MKTKTIILNQKQLTYLFDRKERASVRIAIDRRGLCVVYAPHWCKLSIVEDVITQHSSWIADKVRFWDAGEALESHDRDYRSRKESARKIIDNCVNRYAQKYDFRFGRVAIKRQASLWGSCSSRGNLNFHYKVASLPERLREYIIVHELCHLKALNHSKEFWELVGKIIPDYKARIRELRCYSKSNNYALD